MGRLQGNLSRLLTELNTYAQGEPVCQPRLAAPHADCEFVARNLPLTHSRGAEAFRRICGLGDLLSRKELDKRGIMLIKAGGRLPLEVDLGTVDCVFTYAGPFRYPETSCGFVFDLRIEKVYGATAVATPFDSGGVVKHLRPHDPLPDQVAFLREHEFPVPAYRQYLEACLAVLFASPWEYLGKEGPDADGPIDIVENPRTPRAWTFEVRFKDRLPITGTLLAVFLPVAVAAEDWARAKISSWTASGVDVRILKAPIDGAWERLCEESVSWIRDRIK